MPNQFHPYRVTVEKDPIAAYVAEIERRMRRAKTEAFTGSLTFEVNHKTGLIGNMNITIKESFKAEE